MPGGNVTLYGTCYAALGKDYLLGNVILPEFTRDFIGRCRQISDSGLMIGPEVRTWYPEDGAVHDREHQLLHLTCAALAACQHFDLRTNYDIRAAHRFCEPAYLEGWLGRRNFRYAWIEGNNILFVGQLLIYLRDVEANPTAQDALDLWFDWLDANVDPKTGLWGTNGYCGPDEGVYGGYHQLLIYFHEDRVIRNPRGLVDTVLGLQHRDGGFAPWGNGGACEDVDCVDILVNLYKRFDYRRAEIRHSLGKCVNHISKTQNSDGGFPYNKDMPHSMMLIPDTKAAANTSTAFATWFRIHTLALSAEIIPEHPRLEGMKFKFSKCVSMGWHASPQSWKLHVSNDQAIREISLVAQDHVAQLKWNARRTGVGFCAGWACTEYSHNRHSY